MPERAPTHTGLVDDVAGKEQKASGLKGNSFLPPLPSLIVKANAKTQVLIPKGNQNHIPKMTD